MGDVVPFDITIFNQGNIPATDITVTDYIPDGLSFVDIPANMGWAPATGDDYMYLYTDTLAPFTSTTIQIHLEVLQTATPMNVVNMSEISMAF